MSRALVCVLCALLSVFALAPALVFVVNAQEVSASVADVLRLALPLGIATGAAAVALAIWGGDAARARVATASAAVALLVYAQGNLLVWDYGRFDGQAIDWGRHAAVGWLELAIWATTLAASQLFAKHIVRWAPRLALLAVLLQGAAVGSELAAGRSFEPAPISVGDPDLTAFSSEANVLVLVLDGFQSHSFDAILREDPSIAADLDGFVYFRDTLAVFPTTLMSIPAILSGEIYENREPIPEFLDRVLRQHSLPESFAGAGWSASVVTRATYCGHFERAACTGQLEVSGESAETLRRRDALRIWNVTLFRHLPHVAKQRVYRDHRWLLQDDTRDSDGAGDLLHAPVAERGALVPTDRQQASGLLWSRLARELRADSPARTFKLLHFWSSHSPYLVDESCELLDAARYHASAEPARNVAQSRCTLEAALALVRRLGELDVLDRTLVVILADHGSPSPMMSSISAEQVELNRAFPLLLVKPMGAGAPFEVNDRPASLGDVARTIGALMQLPDSYAGEYLFALPAVRERRFLWYRWEHRFWQAEYLPAIQELRVPGPGRDLSTWRRGRLLEPALR